MRAYKCERNEKIIVLGKKCQYTRMFSHTNSQNSYKNNELETPFNNNNTQRMAWQPLFRYNWKLINGKQAQQRMHQIVLQHFFFNKLSKHCLKQLQLEYDISKRKEHRIENCKKKIYVLNQKAFAYQKLDPSKVLWSKNQTKLAEIYQTKDQKEAYKAIKQIAILNPYKRDGEILDALKMQLENFDVVMNVLVIVQINLEKFLIQYLFLPNNTLPLTIIEVRELQNCMSQEKAITRDGISDTFIKKTKSSQLLQNLQQNITLETNIYLGETSKQRLEIRQAGFIERRVTKKKN